MKTQKNVIALGPHVRENAKECENDQNVKFGGCALLKNEANAKIHDYVKCVKTMFSCSCFAGSDPIYTNKLHIQSSYSSSLPITRVCLGWY